ncbi:MAG: PIN domain-containing protein, partial [Gammaproteobacteria bacterium]
MITRKYAGKRLFVLDTNVLMHDPTAIFRFAEHDIYLPMIVLEELDRGKKGMSEVARNVRQVSRFLDDLMADASKEQIDQGLPLPCTAKVAEQGECGRLFFQLHHMPSPIPDTLPGNTPDNNILGTALALQDMHPAQDVTLVSKDINLRIKAAVVGIRAEDYHNDQVLDDVSLLYSGEQGLPDDFWDRHSKHVDSWQEEGRTFYRVSGPDTEAWYPNQCLYIDGPTPLEAVVRRKEGADAVIELAYDFRPQKHSVWGIMARNRQQNFALN